MNRWLLPEGIEEVVADQALAAESLRRQLLDLFECWGYDLIIPPVIEFTDSLLTGLGVDLDSKTIKVPDQVSGKTMGFRADISPQAARIDARNSTAGPNRVCYAGTVLHSEPSDALSSRAPIQVGVEIFGIDTVAADLEVILLMLQSLALVTDEKLTLDLGHVGICNWLSRVAKENALPAEDLYELVQSKRLPELEQMIADADLNNVLRQQLLAVPSLLGAQSVLDEAERLFEEVDEVLEALVELRMLAKALSERVPEVNLFFDLGEMRGSNYHTGVVFGAYVEHLGAAKRVANGGRYNNVGAAFGRPRAATGFSADLKLLTQLSDPSEEGERYAVYAPISNESGFWEQVNELRADGVRVILGYEDDGVNGASLGCQQELVFVDGEWKLVALA